MATTRKSAKLRCAQKLRPTQNFDTTHQSHQNTPLCNVAPHTHRRPHPTTVLTLTPCKSSLSQKRWIKQTCSLSDPHEIFTETGTHAKGGQHKCPKKAPSRRRSGATIDQYSAVLGSGPRPYSWAPRFAGAGVTLPKGATRHG